MRLADEIAQLLPDGTQERVAKAKDHYNLSIREALRTDTGLRMGRFELARDESGKRRSRDIVNVPVTVEDGLPVALENKPECVEPSRLGRWRPELETLRDGITGGEEMLQDRSVQAPALASRLAAIDEPLNRVKLVIQDLLRELDKSDPVRSLLAINEDVLGVYKYRFSRDEMFPAFEHCDPKIELYWLVIGLVARLMNCSVEALTGVVLAHELGHAFTHVGYDIDGKNWPAEYFADSELSVKEGLAQYYTHRACERLKDKFPELQSTFDQLVPKQPKAYQAHLQWITDYQPEEVRAALLSCRRAKTRASLAEFEGVLRSAKTILSHPN